MVFLSRLSKKKKKEHIEKSPSTDYKKQEPVSPNYEKHSVINAMPPFTSSFWTESIERDVYFEEAGRFLIKNDKASIGMLQRMFKIGFNRSAMIMDQLCVAGVVGPEEGTKPRKILMTVEEFDNYLEGNITNVTDEFTSASDRDSGFDEKSIEEELRKRLGREPSFSPDNARRVLDVGNILITKADYDLPLDFIEGLVLSCYPEDLKILLLDDMSILNLYNGLPTLLLPVVTDDGQIGNALNWIVLEMQRRQKLFIEAGARDYEGFQRIVNRKDSQLPVITILIRELYEIIQGNSVRSALKALMPLCNRFGITVIAFSMYEKKFLSLGELEQFLSLKTAEWCRSLLNREEITETLAFARIDTMSGAEFEQCCAEILGNSGFEGIYITKGSGDFGGDILATKDQIKYVIQCKRYDSNIGVHAVQEVIASRSIYKAHVGVVMTNMYFTAPAKNLAKENNVILWDRDDVNTFFQKSAMIKKVNNPVAWQQ